MKSKPIDAKPAYQDEGVDFTEDFKREKAMIFKAATLQPWVNTIVQMLFPELLTAKDRTMELSAGVTRMTLEMRTLDPWWYGQNSPSLMCPFPTGPSCWRRQWMHCGPKQMWTTDRPVTFPVLREGRGVWMSLSPMEIATLRGHHKRCKGKVLIGGLGLGYSALRVLQSEKVTHVTVVEQFKPLIDLIGPHLKRMFGASFEVRHGDVWEYLGGGVRDFDTLFLDVWEGYGGNRHDHRFERLAEVAKKAGRLALAWG